MNRSSGLRVVHFPVDERPVAPTFPAHFFKTSESPIMPEVQVRKGEPVDRALKRLKTKLEMEGILEEVRRLRAHETPKERTRRKARASAKRGKIRFRFSLNKPGTGAAEMSSPIPQAV